MHSVLYFIRKHCLPSGTKLVHDNATIKHQKARDADALTDGDCFFFDGLPTKCSYHSYCYINMSSKPSCSYFDHHRHHHHRHPIASHHQLMNASYQETCYSYSHHLVSYPADEASPVELAASPIAMKYHV
jgi:hypothetical protein